MITFDNRTSLLERLAGFRRGLIRAAVVLIVGTAVGYLFSDQLFFWAAAPFEKLVAGPGTGVFDVQKSLIFVTPLEAFAARLKLALFAAFLVALPFFFAAGWAGVFEEERGGFIRNVSLSMGCSVFVWSGAAFAYFLILPVALKFFLSFTSPALAATWSVGRYTSFVIQFSLVFGIVFELPVIILALGRLGLVNADILRAYRGYAVVGIFIAAALLTPPDVVTQLFMGVPLLLLYELSLLLLGWFGKASE